MIDEVEGIIIELEENIYEVGEDERIESVEEFK